MFANVCMQGMCIRQIMELNFCYYLQMVINGLNCDDVGKLKKVCRKFGKKKLEIICQ